MYGDGGSIDIPYYATKYIYGGVGWGVGTVAASMVAGGGQLTKVNAYQAKTRRIS